ncbi:hypothetical protein E3Q22_03323 [Wallemia mellicola]|uniref:Signal recognition particle subunit SRP68 n=1 Tax=Wallemia mellicola TaxID=1708541 RepID=A0A4T0R9U2_9BASI|nr:hypothetical protein E3Q24_01705 [Wallemia mellicola]TIB76855.1 hypothetical protein E3Q22_03323 [Wallemia mellicola]TIB83538.1 hypothetical protein E3Q21_02847 [Wallemia mellicola]TIB86380.1 hypothetical protein E3Q20_02839 [Wallemia mellicola]TIC11225.1 hypothetical protein E3Q15_02737 [Wallemia mellicola]
MSLESLNLLNSERNSYGIRSDDYAKYSRRINKLRRGLKLTHGKSHKYQKVTNEAILKNKDPRVLEMLLLQSDRYWAQSSEYPPAAASKLKRSLQFSNLLLEASKKFNLHSSEFVQLVIYDKFIEASYNLSRKKYQNSLEAFSIAFIYLKNLTVAAPNDKVRALAEGWLDQISPQIRYCAYQQGDKTKAHEVERIAKESTKNYDFINVEYDQEDTTTKISGVVWRGEELKLTSVDLVDAMQKLQTVIDKKSNKTLSNFDEVLNSYSNVIDIAPEGKLKQVLTYKMLVLRIERDLEINKKLDINDAANNRSKVKILSGIIYTLEQIRNLDLVESDDLDLSAYVEVKLTNYQAFRNYTLGVAHLMANNYGPSIRLLESSKFYIRSCSDLLKNLEEEAINHPESFKPVINEEVIDNFSKDIEESITNSKKALFAQQFKRPLFFDIANTYVEPPMEYILNRSQTQDEKKAPKPANVTIAKQEEIVSQESPEPKASSGWFGSLWKR